MIENWLKYELEIFNVIVKLFELVIIWEIFLSNCLGLVSGEGGIGISY